MSVYARFKRSPEGFRKLVELLESTPSQRRQKMIDVGMEEDARYTELALRYVMDFNDILALSDEELAELCAKTLPLVLACAIHDQPEAVQRRFLSACPPQTYPGVRDGLETAFTPLDISTAQLKVIEVARDLERRGYVRAKRIPLELTDK